MQVTSSVSHSAFLNSRNHPRSLRHTLAGKVLRPYFRPLPRGHLQLPKTDAAIRDVDLSTPVQSMLIEFAKCHQSGEFIFASKTGKPLEPSHVQRFITKKNGVPGAHALRRYRVTWLETQGCPRGLEAAWIGHSNGDITARYDKTAEDREFRRKQVERIGTGLMLSEIFVGLPEVANLS